VTPTLRRALVAVAAVLGVVAVSIAAWAFWSSSGTGSASAAVASFAPPAIASPSVTTGGVTLSWSASAAPGAGTVDYSVERRDELGSTWSDACGTSTTVHTPAVGCTDVPNAGTYVWRVTAYFRTWTTTSGASDAATVTDVIPPTGSITAPATDAIVRGTIAVTSDSADADSGVASALFQRSPAGTDTWTNITAADTTAPYSASWNTTAVADGLYDLRVTTTDNAAHSYVSALTTDVRVDNTAPAVTLSLASSPTGAFFNGTTVYFKANAAGTFRFVATVTDAGSGPASAAFPLLSATNWTTHAAETVTTPAGGPYTSSAFAWSSGAIVPASHTVTVADAAGNTATKAATFTIDTTAPTGAVTAPAANANVRGSVSVTSSSADTGSGVASAQFQSSPAGAGTWSNFGVDTATPFATTWDTTTFTDGLYDVRVVTTDNVGITFTSPTIANVRVDNTAPTGSVTAPLTNANLRGAVSMTSDSADTGGSGITSAQFQRSPAGTNTWTNQGSADTTSPYAVTWTTTSGTADGLYDLRVITTDKAGNTFTSPVVTNLRVDNTAPTGLITAPAASANIRGTVSVTSSSADTGSGVASAQFQSSPAGAATWSNLGAADTLTPFATTWDTTTFTDGLYDLRVITTDVAGNTLTSATITNVRVDNTAPTGVITAPAASANIRGTVSVTANSADTGGSGVASTLFQRSPAGTSTWTNIAAADTTSPYAASWVTTGVSDGLYDLQVITTDKSGNTLTSVTTNVRVDNTAPTVSLALAPGATGAFRTGTTIYFKANAAGSFAMVATVTDAGSGPASATYPVVSTAGWTHAAETDTTPAGGPYASSTFSWTSGATAPGSYTVTVADAAGNTATSATTFTIDSTAPTGAVTAPAAAANVRGSAVSVTSSSADAGSGVGSAQFQSSPAGAGTWSNLGAADTLTPFATTWDTTTFTDGLYDLRVITTDNVGNTLTSATIANVRVDNTAPTGSLTAPLTNAFVSGASVAVSANSADTGSGVNSAQFQTSPRGAGTWTNLGAADTTSPYAVTWNTTSGYPDGLYDLRVVTADKAGNTFTSATTPVEIQNAAPTTTAVALVNGGSTSGKLEQGDQIVVTYSQTLSVSSMCSTWSGNLTDQSLAATGDVTVTLTDGGAGDDTVTITSATCTLHIGTFNVGATGYITGGNNTFRGLTVATTSTVTWNAATRTLTITLGAPTGTGTRGTVASSAAVSTPDAAIKNVIGTAITGTFTTSTVPQF